MSEENTPPPPAVSPEQQQQNRYIDLVVTKLKDRLGDRDVEIAQVQARMEMIAAERDYFLNALRENGLIQEAPQIPAPETVSSDEVEVLEPPSI
jgi:hypothetical protein